MPKSPRWCNSSARCHLEWRPSRWLTGLLLLLTAGAAVSVLASGLDRAPAWAVAVVVAASGLRTARKESRRSSVTVAIAVGVVRVDGRPVEGFRLAWRGPLAFMSWLEQGRRRRRRLVWWPDTLPPAGRRELRLAAPAEKAPRAPASMAP